MVSPLDIAGLKGTHPLWEADVEQFGPWDNWIEVDGFGSFVKGGKESSATIVVTGTSGTTMETARMLAENGILGQWDAVLSVEQSRGRGQLRRPWVSPPGNMHLSVVMPDLPEQGIWREALRDLLPLVSGYMAGCVLEELGAELKIKWPNDLLQENRKVGGMLIEESGGIVVLGLGLNLAQSPPDSQMREDRSVSATVLQTNRHSTTPLGVGETLVNRGKSVYAVLLNEKTPTDFLSELRSRIAWLGEIIEVREGDGEVFCVEITGIAPNGGLVVRRGERESILTSGSIFSL